MMIDQKKGGGWFPIICWAIRGRGDICAIIFYSHYSKEYEYEYMTNDPTIFCEIGPVGDQLMNPIRKMVPVVH